MNADALATLIARRDPNVLVACAGRPDALRTMYGHWTTIVRRSRLGLVMSTGSDTDGELLGEPLPRRSPLLGRAGLAWVVDGSGRRLVQVGRHAAGATSAEEGPRRMASRHETRLPLLRIDRE